MTTSPAAKVPLRVTAVARRLLRAGRSPDALALATLTAIAAAFFAPVLSGRFWLPQGGGDLASFLWPMYRFIAGRLAAGDLPLWNPHQYAGAPLLADNQSGLLYPPLLALYVLKPAFSYVDLERVVIGHTLFTGVAMYACLRLWRHSDNAPNPGHTSGFAPAPALLGAVAWMLNDVFITHLGNLNFNAAAGWLPLAILGMHRAITPGSSPRLRDLPLPQTWGRGSGGEGLPAGSGGEGLPHATYAWLALSALTLALSALAGHAQATFLCAAAVAAYAVYRAAADRRWWPLVALAIVGALAFALAAPALLPALALRASTVRATYDYATSVQYSLPPRALVGLVAPWWWGRGAAAFHGDWDRVEVGYVGLVPLALAIIAVAVAAARRRPHAGRRDVAFFGLLAAVALLVALGPATPVHRWLIGPLHLPFRAPARYLLLLDFALAWLAAAGAQHVATALDRRAAMRSSSLPDGRPPSPWRRLAALSGAILVLATAVDLVALGAGVEIDRSDPTAGFRRTATHDWLVAHGGAAAPSSSGPIDPSEAVAAEEGDKRLGDLSPRIDEATGAWQPGAAQLWGLYSLGGVYNPSRLGAYSFAMDGLAYRGSPLYNRFGVLWCVTDRGAAPSDRGRWERVYIGDPTVDVWRNKGRVQPRVNVVYDTRIAPDDATAFDALRDPSDDALTHVWLVATDLARDPAARAAAALIDPDPDPAIDPGYSRPGLRRVEIVRYDPDRIVIDVDTLRPVFVVLTDVWHPDWHATVDGESAPVLRADFLFRAVPLTSFGRHRVVMTYRPRGWRPGLALAAAAWAALGMGCLARLRGRRRRPTLRPRTRPTQES